MTRTSWPVVSPAGGAEVEGELVAFYCEFGHASAVTRREAPRLVA